MDCRVPSVLLIFLTRVYLLLMVWCYKLSSKDTLVKGFPHHICTELRLAFLLARLLAESNRMETTYNYRCEDSTETESAS